MNIRRAVPYRHVEDLEACLEFHRKLGYVIRQDERDDNGIYWAELDNGASRVMLSSRPVHDRSNLTWLFVDDADAAYKTLTAAGLTPLGPVEEQQHGTREFLIQDPDGEVYVVSHHIR